MNILVQRINISNNENRRNKIINRVFVFVEINILIWLFIWEIKCKLNIWIQHLSNKYIKEHRHLSRNETFNQDLDINFTEKYNNIYKNNSNFNYNDEKFLLEKLLNRSYEEYYGKLENLIDNKNNSNIDLKIKNSSILKLTSYDEIGIYLDLINSFKSQKFFVIELNNYFINIRYFLYSNINELNIKNDNINKRFIAKGLFSGILFDGKINNKINFSAFVEFQFKTENETIKTYDNRTYNESFIKEFTLLLLIDDYGLNFKINSKIVNYNESLYYKYLMKILNVENKFYRRGYKKEIAIFFLIIIFFITNAVGLRCLIKNLKSKENLISAISFESSCFNILCHLNFINLFLIHLYFSNINKFIKLIYVFELILAIIKYIYNDCEFILLFRRIKMRRLTSFQIFKLNIRVFISYFLYLLMYFLLLIVLFNMNLFIFYISIMIWTPQILHNIVNNNKYIYPFIYIFFSTYDIISVSFLFYIMKINNINKYILVICYIYILLSIVILYLQTFLGPRFMLPSRFHKKEFSIYKSYKEILKEKSKSTIYNEICIICFSTILNIVKKEEDKVNNKNNFNTHTEISNENNNSITTNRNHFIPNINNQSNNNSMSNASQSLRVIKFEYYSFYLKIKKLTNTFKKLGLVCKSILSEGLFNFYTIKENFKTKEIMLLPCGHIFHSVCLNFWLEKKKICPICSKPIAEYLNK